MKITKIISSFLLFFFVFALIQCGKNEILDKNSTNKSNFELRDINPCAPTLSGANCVTETEFPEVIIAGFQSCPVQAELMYKRCDNKFQFYDFILIVPNSSDCQSLLNYLDGLNDQQLMSIKDYIFNQGKITILQAYSDINPKLPINDVSSFKNLCTQNCKWLDLKCLADERTGDKDSGDNLNYRGGDGCWKYGTVKCGQGCCITTARYIRDINGKIVLSSSKSEPYGECQNGPEPKWPHFNNPCGPNGSPTSPCIYRCE